MEVEHIESERMDLSLCEDRNNMTDSRKLGLLDALLSLMNNEVDEVSECFCEEMLDLENVILSTCNWDVITYILIPLYLNDPDRDAVLFVRFLIDKFDCMPLCNQREVANFFAEVSLSRLESIKDEVILFICRNATKPSTVRDRGDIALTFFRIILRIGDLDELSWEIGTDPDMRNFVEFMMELEADYEDSDSEEVLELLSQLLDETE